MCVADRSEKEPSPRSRLKTVDGSSESSPPRSSLPCRHSPKHRAEVQALVAFRLDYALPCKGPFSGYSGPTFTKKSQSRVPWLEAGREPGCLGPGYMLAVLRSLSKTARRILRSSLTWIAQATLHPRGHYDEPWMACFLSGRQPLRLCSVYENLSYRIEDFSTACVCCLSCMLCISP